MRQRLPVLGVLLLVGMGGCKGAPQAPAASPIAAEARRVAPAYEGQEHQEPRRRPRRGRPQEEAAPGQFDFYLLNLSWSPEFCTTHGDSPECGRGLGFVVHGLWPQDTDGDYPQHCSDAAGPSHPQADTDIFPTVGLVEHEWQTHGTCSGLSVDDYFAAVHKASAGVKVPSSIGQGGDGDGVSPAELLGRFAAANPGYPAGSFALSCGNNRLTAVEICLSKELRPEACQGVRSCRANVVKVTPRS